MPVISGCALSSLSIACVLFVSGVCPAPFIRCQQPLNFRTSWLLRVRAPTSSLFSFVCIVAITNCTIYFYIFFLYYFRTRTWSCTFVSYHTRVHVSVHMYRSPPFSRPLVRVRLSKDSGLISESFPSEWGTHLKLSNPLRVSYYSTSVPPRYGDSPTVMV